MSPSSQWAVLPGWTRALPPRGHAWEGGGTEGRGLPRVSHRGLDTMGKEVRSRIRLDPGGPRGSPRLLCASGPQCPRGPSGVMVFLERWCERKVEPLPVQDPGSPGGAWTGRGGVSDKQVYPRSGLRLPKGGPGGSAGDRLWLFPLELPDRSRVLRAGAQRLRASPHVPTGSTCRAGEQSWDT